MTIGIGVLSSTKPYPETPRPDSIILMSDTMGSTQTDSTDELHKMWLNDDLKLYACGAGRLEHGGELFSIFEDAFRAIDASGEKRTHGRAFPAIAQAFHGLRSQYFQMNVMPKYFVQTVQGMLKLGDEKDILNAWQNMAISIQMIVGTFDHTGQAYLYRLGEFIDENGQLIAPVMLTEFPGYATIGTGSDNAHSWLNYRAQGLGRSIEHSAYHAFEAKKMAARAPTVNDDIDIGIVMPGGKSFHLTKYNPEIEGCPVSLIELEKQFKRYGPQDTEKLGHPRPKPLASGKKAGTR